MSGQREERYRHELELPDLLIECEGAGGLVWVRIIGPRGKLRLKQIYPHGDVLDLVCQLEQIAEGARPRSIRIPRRGQISFDLSFIANSSIWLSFAGRQGGLGAGFTSLGPNDAARLADTLRLVLAEAEAEAGQEPVPKAALEVLGLA